MPTEIVIVINDLRLNGYLDDSPTAQALAEALPIEGRAQLWGEEIYFPVDRVVAELDESAAVVVNVVKKRLDHAYRQNETHHDAVTLQTAGGLIAGSPPESSVVGRKTAVMPRMI